jgi:hypothetical protein
MIEQTSFSRMVRAIDWAPICLSLEEVAVRAGHDVLIKVDDNSIPIVGNMQEILGQQFISLIIYYYC